MQTKDEVLAELMAEHVALKKVLGTLTGNWVPHDVRRWSEKTGVGRFHHFRWAMRFDWWRNSFVLRIPWELGWWR